MNLLQQNSMNLILKKILLNNNKNNIYNVYYSFNNNDFDTIYMNSKNRTPNINFFKKGIYNLIRPFSRKMLLKKLKFKSKPKYEKLQKIILSINRTSLTLKRSRVFRYKVISCIGTNRQWVGVGEGKNRLFRKSFTKSINVAKKYVYNLTFNCNDYKQLKYKGCKFKALNMIENKKNLKIYDNITKIAGYKKIKLVSYSSKTPINVLKFILNNF